MSPLADTQKGTVKQLRLIFVSPAQLWTLRVYLPEASTVGKAAANFRAAANLPKAQEVLLDETFHAGRNSLNASCTPRWSNLTRFTVAISNLKDFLRFHHSVFCTPGFHTTARELQTCTLEGPGLQTHHQNSTRRPPEREKERK